MIVLLLACAPEIVSGTLVDVRTGLGLSGLRVEASHVAGRCDTLASDVVDGVFTFPKPCRGDYALALDDPERMVLVEPGPLPESLVVRAWPIPPSATEGVFLVDDSGTLAVPALGRERQLTLLGKTDVVRFPDVLPETWPIADGWIVVIGTDLAGLDASLIRLVDAPERRFGSPDLPQLVPAWKYLGVALPADGEMVPSDAALGEGCVSDSAAGRKIAGCPASSISPGGDYAVYVGDRLAMFRGGVRN